MKQKRKTPRAFKNNIYTIHQFLSKGDLSKLPIYYTITFLSTGPSQRTLSSSQCMGHFVVHFFFFSPLYCFGKHSYWGQIPPASGGEQQSTCFLKLQVFLSTAWQTSGSDSSCPLISTVKIKIKMAENRNRFFSDNSISAIANVRQQIAPKMYKKVHMLFYQCNQFLQEHM